MIAWLKEGGGVAQKKKKGSPDDRKDMRRRMIGLSESAESPDIIFSEVAYCEPQRSDAPMRGWLNVPVERRLRPASAAYAGTRRWCAASG
jgi:hypothetical protein